jgi:acetyl-CoA acetyltransferase
MTDSLPQEESSWRRTFQLPTSKRRAPLAAPRSARRCAIRSGEIDVALVLGVEKMPRGFMDPSMIYSQWQIEMGMSLNPAYWSMRARRHMYDYGTTESKDMGIKLAS